MGSSIMTSRGISGEFSVLRLACLVFFQKLMQCRHKVIYPSLEWFGRQHIFEIERAAIKIHFFNLFWQYKSHLYLLDFVFVIGLITFTKYAVVKNNILEISATTNVCNSKPLKLNCFILSAKKFFRLLPNAGSFCTFM